MDIHIQGVLILKDAMRIGKYLKASEKNRKKDSISGVKGLLQMNKTHFEGVASIEDSVHYTGKDYNKCLLHHKKPINPNDPKSKIMLCRCDYFDLEKHCEWCNKDCKKYRTWARFDDKSGPFEFGIYKAKNNNPFGKNKFVDRTPDKHQVSIEIMKDLIKNDLFGDEAVIKYAPKMSNWVLDLKNVYVIHFSNISSDDSDYTRKKKKGKMVVIDSIAKNLIAEKESIDLEQARIQSNYVELNNKSQDPEEFLSESELYESDVILDISEDMLRNASI
ncbi:6662_t:CDS:2 [Dentiscutata erythropus]|uniref:6662_t:CDS:1 n=1 Tax=Dentiscutata erythropus TaxID=1348616 RepID=A0A9N8WSC9_9GLOM|nr:6662_t:CDS:2 [Dentiscutata erythropus]